MACAEHKERLIEAALDPKSAAAHEGQFVRHVETCSACRAELDRQRALYKQIEDGVAALVGVQAPAAIAARVRQQIASKHPPSFVFRNWAWFGAAAMATAAIVVAMVLRPNQAPSGHRDVAAPATAAASGKPPAATSMQAAVEPPVTRSKHGAKVSIARARATAPKPELVDSVVVATTGPPRVQVIVPAGQREAVLRLVDALQSGRVDAASLVKPAQSLEPDELKIAPLEIKPIVPDENDAGSSPPDTKPSIRN